MTETTESLDTAAPAKSGRTRKGEGLSSMVLPDLKALAGQLGIRGTSGMRKGDLVAAIAARQSGAGATSPSRETRSNAAAGSGSDGEGAGTTQAPPATPSTNGHSTSDPVSATGRPDRRAAAP